MHLDRRNILQLFACATALPFTVRRALAESYPSRPLRLIVSYPAGNASDIIGRVIAQSLAERLGQPVIVENRPGGSGTVGAGVVAKAAPDGYALLLEVVTANVINSTLYPELGYDFARDILPVARIAEGPYVMVVNPEVPAKTIPEFIAYAKANPGKIDMASTGTGSPTQIFGELFKITAGIDVLHVPYKGSFMPDLLSGQVQLVFGPISQMVEQVKSGRLRALGVTTAKRQRLLPDVPAIAEILPGYEASGWYGIGAPKGTPATIVDKLNHETNTSLADPKMATRLAELGVVPKPTTPAEFGAFIATETKKWAKVIRAANIIADKG
ncbi:MAG: tripartite tricarboxylate transporter substrate binding protein [Xanthobacteraceae bacterium]